MTTEYEEEQVKKGKRDDKQAKLYAATKEFLAEKIEQIEREIEDTDTSLGADPYVIFPIDED